METLEQQREQYTNSNFVDILSKQTGVTNKPSSPKNETESHRKAILRILENASNLMSSSDVCRILKSENKFYPSSTASILSELYHVGKVERIKLMKPKKGYYYALPEKFKSFSVPEKVETNSNPIFKNVVTAEVTNIEDLENQVSSTPRKSFWARLLGI